MNKLQLTLERAGKRAIVVFRADDYEQSRRGYFPFGASGPCVDRLKWGSGAMWTVVQVEKMAEGC